MSARSEQPEQGAGAEGGEAATTTETLQLGDGVVLGNNRKGVVFGWTVKGEVHVRLLDIERWPGDVGTCENWKEGETRHVARGDMPSLRQVAFPLDGEVAGPLLRCPKCMQGLREMKRIVSTE